MFADDTIAGSWEQLAARVDRDGAIKKWAVAEPALIVVATATDLVALTGPDTDSGVADEILGALVRTGSVRGGDDPDAVLLVLHLLSAGAATIAAELADLHPTVLQLLVGTLTVAVRSYGQTGPRGGGVRERAFAANLLRDARRAVLREFRPHCTRDRPRDTDILISPLDVVRTTAVLDGTIPGPDEDLDELDLVDVLMWARRNGVIAERDLNVLVAAERARERHVAAVGQCTAAAALGIHASTLRRRRQRALAALRASRHDYLERWLAA